MDSITLKISGMTCGGCSSSLKKLLEEDPAVQEADVSHEAGTAEISHDADQISMERLEKIIDRAGFGLES